METYPSKKPASDNSWHDTMFAIAPATVGTLRLTAEWTNLTLQDLGGRHTQVAQAELQMGRSGVHQCFIRELSWQTLTLAHPRFPALFPKPTIAIRAALYCASTSATIDHRFGVGTWRPPSSHPPNPLQERAAYLQPAALIRSPMFEPEAKTGQAASAVTAMST